VKRSFLLTLIATVLLLSAASPNVASENRRADQHKDSAQNQPSQANDEQQILAAAAVLHDAEISLREAIQSIEAQRIKEAKQARTTQESYRSPSVVVQICLVIVGLIYSFFAYLQVSAIRQSLQVGQRAYVNVKGIEKIEPKNVDALPFSPIDFIIRNSGRTPAKNLLIQVGGEISEDPFGKGTPTSLDEIRRTPYHGMGLPPDTDYRARFNFPNAHPREHAVGRGELYATCWATISYLDHFGVWHSSIEPFCYDAETHTFDRHPIGYREADRRYESYQQRAEVWFRAWIKRFR
jgi:Na+-transporting methylmalonyl-CoA/oxaloacetate decarboxylase gamma subunit